MLNNTQKKVKINIKSNTRTVHDFPNVSSVTRNGCAGEFFTPENEEIKVSIHTIRKFFCLESVGLILPLASEREWFTFPKTLSYVNNMGLEPERTLIVHSQGAKKLIDTMELRAKGYLTINEEELIKIINVERVNLLFAADIKRLRGKGRAFFITFVFLKYIYKWKTLKYLFFLDVDTNIEEYMPLHYLGYTQAMYPNENRFCLLTAQNNALRDNHYLFVMRDYWRNESDLGRHYAAHLDKIVWSLTGELMLRWDLIADQIPFSIAYGIETVWQIFAADKVASSTTEKLFRIAQVVNPKTKRDGGNMGQNGRCYDAAMYRQLNLMAWFLIKHGKRLDQLSVKDYRFINTGLNSSQHTVILPDNNDHNLPYRVKMQSDLFIPPLTMLEAEGCLLL